ncbi:mammalian cell entry protein [Mycolicibacterium madagascariense]|uniref:Mammalian cell entry protein n=1 Tax=Mycolicibacterium madagascariense TaxID=212765 RepID=A0A7I7XAZ1_9MYCO|nr:MCE family protein [Mycolicibacterium madagascariense]MCV7014162.1 MCE family protein [Mycolicibacterium madagascariense]BBZ25771.1 mammalian cell entry protein [Mycolicibacterium madagascariense]
MHKYRGTGLARAGFIAVVLMACIILVGLSPTVITAWATTVRYDAVFSDASGLTVGNKVTISGMDVGAVSDITVIRGGAKVTFTVSADTTLGSQTTARIATGTLLGQRVLTLDSRGTPTLAPRSTIPMSRTFSPYTLTDAVGELTANTASTDTASLNTSLDTLASTLDQIAPQLGGTLDGVSRISAALNDRDTALAQLLRSGSDVTSILARRSQQVNTLILDADDLVGVLAERRRAIVELLASTSAVSQQLTGLVNDDEAKLAPTLQRLNRVTEVLERNRDNIAKALPGLAKYQLTLGETVSNGPFYSAYVPNLDLPQILQPFLDYAFGFRRGVDAGRPPDTAGPRAELPFPYNSIPPQPR